MFKRVIVIAALLMASATAFALPKPSEVKAAFAAGDYARAELLLKEVMVERPTATVHYQLGQVYTKQGKHADALNEYRQAQALDPSLRFASSASAFTRTLADAQSLVAPPPVISVPAPPEIRVQTSAAAAPVSNNDGMVYFLIFFVLIAGGGTGFYMYAQYSAGRKIKQEEEAEFKETSGKLLEFAKRLEDAVLIAKTATYSDLSKRQVLDRVVALQSQVRSMLAEVKDRKGVTSYRMAALESSVGMAVEDAANGLPVFEPKHDMKVVEVKTPAPTKPKEKKRTPKVEAFKPRVVPPPPPAPKTRHVRDDVPPPSYPRHEEVQHHHTTTRDSGSDLLTGVLIGSMISDQAERDAARRREEDRRDHELAAERRREREEDSRREAEERRIQEEENRRDSYRAPEPSSFDTGRDSNDSYESSSSSSIDSSSSPSDSDSY